MDSSGDEDIVTEGDSASSRGVSAWSTGSLSGGGEGIEEENSVF